MSQITPPIRIVLVASIALIAAWMLFLRPKTDEVVPPAEPAPNVQTSEPAVSGPGKAAEAAQGAVNAANGQLSQQESVDGVDAGEAAAGTQSGTAAGTATEKPTTPSKAAATAAIDALDDVPHAMLEAIAKEKVLVILFWNGKSADDRAVRTALSKVDRWDGRVYVHTAPIKSISRYGPIAQGVDVEQSPTVVIVDPEMRAETLVGYVDTQTIDQTVVDAFRNTTGLFTSAYLRKINSVCANASSQLFAIPDPSTAAQVPGALSAWQTKWQRFEAKFKAVPAPKKFRGLKRKSVADSAAYTALVGEWIAFLGPKPTLGRFATSLDRFGGRSAALTKRYNRRMDDHHVLSCGSHS